MNIKILVRVKSQIAKRKELCFRLVILAGVGLLCLLAVDGYVTDSAEGKIFENLEDCPKAPVALVLGTAKYYHGRNNLFYTYRLQAASELFKSGKVRAILVSGDNSGKDYDEPGQMKTDLIEMGVPKEYITCDYAGFRTLDSVVRAKEVFGQKQFIIVSQRFHCERGIYIAGEIGCTAYGYPAGDVSGPWHLKVRLREIFARCKAVYDVAFGVEPKFYGEPVVVNMSQE
jgi:SanA protein